MANYIFSTNFITGTASGSTTLSAAFAASNVISYTRPQKCWKATGVTNETLSLDFTSDTSLAAFVLDDVNFSSVDIARKANGAGGFTNIATGVAVAQDPADGRYKLYYALTGFTYRYLRITVASGATDNSSYARVGSFVGLSAVTEWTYNPSGEFLWQPTRNVAEQRFAGGGSEPIQLGPRGAIVGFSAPTMPTASLTNILTVLGYDYGQPLVLYRNAGNTYEVYICRRIGVTPLEYVGPNRLRFGQMLFEEVV